MRSRPWALDLGLGVSASVPEVGSTCPGRKPQVPIPRRALRGALCLLLAVGVVAGCTATIQMKDGRAIETKILGSSSTHVYIPGEEFSEIAIPAGNVIHISRGFGESVIHERSGKETKAAVVRTDGHYVYAGTYTSKRVALARDDIIDIDHPGNVMAGVSAPVLLTGLVFLYMDSIQTLICAQDIDGCGEMSGVAALLSSVLYGSSLPFFVWGLSDWGTSKGAVATEGAPELVAPVVASLLTAGFLAVGLADSAISYRENENIGAIGIVAYSSAAWAAIPTVLAWARFAKGRERRSSYRRQARRYPAGAAAEPPVGPSEMSSTPSKQLSGCDLVFAQQEEALEELELLVSGRAVAASSGAVEMLAKVAERELQHARMCFGYFEKGLELKARRKKLEKQFGQAAPEGQPEERSGPDPNPPGDTGPTPEQQFRIRFLGIAPVAGGDRDLKGVVVGFSF